MKCELVASCMSLGLHLTNLEEIRSRRDYNCYKIEYPSEVKQATSIVYDYLTEKGNVAAIEKYELEPFAIRVG